MLYIIYALRALIVVGLLFYSLRKRAALAQPTAKKEREILARYVLFYQQLGAADKVAFEQRVRVFLTGVRVTGVGTQVADLDKVLIAAGAIIPIFAFKNWVYPNINEVLLYPSSFDHKYNTTGEDRNVLGMVGDGAMQSMMLLSQPDLRNGFIDAHSRSNTAIHEFVHLVDKADGYADGFPEALIEHEYAVPWLKRIHEEIRKIQAGKSDINPYGATNEAEFLAVAGDYFFSQPERMEREHPGLFQLLTQVFVPAVGSDGKVDL